MGQEDVLLGFSVDSFLPVMRKVIFVRMTSDADYVVYAVCG